ncbi:MAG: hypothetical protein AB1426_12720 [Bacillota bacterium]
MIRDLVDGVGTYLERFRRELEELRRKIAPSPNAEVASPPHTLQDGVVRTAAKLAEGSPEFETLGTVAAKAAGREVGDLVFVSPLKHFFRRRGAYLAIARGESVTPESVADDLEKELGKPGTIIRVRHLVSLPWADVEDGIPTVDAGWFRLRRYSVDELKRLLEYEARLVFYPESACYESELRFLSDQWWLEVDDIEELPPVGSISVDFSAISRTLRFTDVSSKVEQALAVVILLRWEDEHGHRSTWWSRLPLGHRVTLRESLFDWPPSIISGDYYDVFENGPEILIRRYRCSRIQELPSLASKVETLATLDEARFIPEVVFRYLLKAVMASGEVSYKIDQLIYHVIAMDALVGSGASGGRSAIFRRIAVLVGDTVGQDVERRVKALYDERSALAHGGRKEEIAPDLSWDAHELLVRATRRAIDFFFSCKVTGQELARDEFLTFLDVLATTRGTARVRELTERWEELY